MSKAEQFVSTDRLCKAYSDVYKAGSRRQQIQKNLVKMLAVTELCLVPMLELRPGSGIGT